MNKEISNDEDDPVRKPVPIFDLDIQPETSQYLKEPHPGAPCPKCKEGVLDYNGLLNLVCTQCGYTLAGCST